MRKRINIFKGDITRSNKRFRISPYSSKKREDRIQGSSDSSIGAWILWIDTYIGKIFFPFFHFPYPSSLYLSPSRVCRSITETAKSFRIYYAQLYSRKTTPHSYTYILCICPNADGCSEGGLVANEWVLEAWKREERRG